MSHSIDVSLDPELWRMVDLEKKRQENHIELIASENYASFNVMALQGSLLTNKYAEGYPAKRYYSGCEYVDQVESLAIERAKKLFKADYANVQPHSGSQANAAALMALLKPMDTFLAMGLNHGGHLTHGASVNFSGQLYHAVHYGVDAAGFLDYEEIETLAHRHRPRLLVAGFSSYTRQIDWNRLAQIARQVNAYFMVDMAHVAGLIATDLYPSPLACADVVTSTTHKTLRGPRGGLIVARSNPELEKRLNQAVFPGTQGGPLMHVIAAKAAAFQEALQPEFKIYQQHVLHNAQVMARVMMRRGFSVVSGGTDNHMFVVDLSTRNLSGKDAAHGLHRAGLVVNKNSIPNDPASPWLTSGIRVGTPAITTRGFRETESEQIGHWMADVLSDLNNENLLDCIRQKAFNMCAQFPVYS